LAGLDGGEVGYYGHLTAAEAAQLVDGGFALSNDAYIYLRGDATTDDSIRMSYQSGSDGVLLEARDSGTWTTKHNFNMA
jgi:hypothetical protein